MSMEKKLSDIVKDTVLSNIDEHVRTGGSYMSELTYQVEEGRPGTSLVIAMDSEERVVGTLGMELNEEERFAEFTEKDVTPLETARNMYSVVVGLIEQAKKVASERGYDKLVFKGKVTPFHSPQSLPVQTRYFLTCIRRSALLFMIGFEADRQVDHNYVQFSTPVSEE